MQKIIKNFGLLILGAFASGLLLLSGLVPFTAQNAVSLILNPSETIAQAVFLLNDTPKPEIVEAVREEVAGKETGPQTLVDTLENIKPAELPDNEPLPVIEPVN